MTHLDEWQAFTSRYGLNDCHPALGDWQSRHKAPRTDAAKASEISWCRCPGPSLSRSVCALKLTQEDGLCDECRRWCLCVDGAGDFHLIADVGRPVTA